jgi:hypothetical protein
MTDDHSTSTENQQRADLLSRARSQLTAATSEFQRGLSKIKDPGTRRELTASYVYLPQRNSEHSAPLPGPVESAVTPETGEQAADLPQTAPQGGPREAGADT